MSALAATRICSACTTSGRRSMSDAGSPAGIAGGDVGVGQALARDRRRRPAEQQRQRVLDDRDLLLDEGNRGGGLRPQRLNPIQLEPVRHAAVQPVAEVAHRVVVDPQGLTCDLELQVELAQQEVVGRDVADQRHEDAAARLVAREQQGERRFVLAPQPAEQIDLPGELETTHEVLVRRIVGGRPVLRFGVRRSAARRS